MTYTVNFTIKDSRPPTMAEALSGPRGFARVISQNAVTDEDLVEVIEKAIRILQIERDAALEKRTAQ